MKHAAGIALLGLFSLSAQAGPADPGLLVGVSGMLTSYEISGDAFDDQAVGAKLSVQYRINKYLGIEGSWLHSGDFSDDTNGDDPGGNVDVDLDGMTIHAIGYLPLESEEIQLYGKVGIYDFDQNLDIGGVYDVEQGAYTAGSSSSRSADGLTVGVGAQIAMASKVSLRLEGDIFDLDGGDFWTVSLGVNYHFGPL